MSLDDGARGSSVNQLSSWLKIRQSSRRDTAAMMHGGRSLQVTPSDGLLEPHRMLADPIGIYQLLDAVTRSVSVDDTLSNNDLRGLGFEQQPARVAFAAVSAWIVGFLIVPVPAGAGVRELMFLLASGLAGGPAVAVAAVSRLTFILIDAIAGVTSLLIIKARPTPAPADRSDSSP